MSQFRASQSVVLPKNADRDIWSYYIPDGLLHLLERSQRASQQCCQNMSTETDLVLFMTGLRACVRIRTNITTDWSTAVERCITFGERRSHPQARVCDRFTRRVATSSERKSFSFSLFFFPTETTEHASFSLFSLSFSRDEDHTKKNDKPVNKPFMFPSYHSSLKIKTNVPPLQLVS